MTRSAKTDEHDPVCCSRFQAKCLLHTRTNRCQQNAANECRFRIIGDESVPFNSKLPERVSSICRQLFEAIRREIHHINAPMGGEGVKLIGNRRINPLKQVDG